MAPRGHSTRERVPWILGEVVAATLAHHTVEPEFGVNEVGEILARHKLRMADASHAHAAWRTVRSLGSAASRASFGSVSLSRAYADWSVPANAAYKDELMERALHLVQLFTASGVKNGADIRLAVDAVEDLMRHPEISHVVLVAGDSDYVPLAQSCKQLGRYVVGIGVAGSTSRALVSACDEFIDYAHLPGVAPKQAATRAATKATAKKVVTKKTPAKSAVSAMPDAQAATDLLVRAIRVGLQKSDDDWVYAAGVKSQMQRMDPAFKEKSLGFSTFREFVESRSDRVVSKTGANGQLALRLT